jgi:hypothetical protein
MTMGAPFPRLACSYDDGSFNKDEQGWCAARTEVSSNVETGAVSIRHSGDRNGLDAYDTVTETRIAEVFTALQLVKLAHPRWYFDLATNRLVDGNQDVVLARGTNPRGDWLESARVNEAIDFVFSLLELTGGPRLARPTSVSWPARTTAQSRYDFTEVELPLTGGFSLRLRQRPAAADEWLPELVVWLTGEFSGASVVVTECGLPHVAVRGGLEHHAAARAFAEAWLHRHS